MPFDRIEVALSARPTEDSRAVLHFDYFKVLPGGAREKLSVGRQDVIWVRRDADGGPSAAPLPAAVRQALAAGKCVLPSAVRKGRRPLPQATLAEE
jgi:hypothetical protein